jgi:hypothetical protein
MSVERKSTLLATSAQTTLLDGAMSWTVEGMGM